MSTRKQQLNELIKDKDFRREFVSDYVQEILAAQIKELREHRQWTQQELGDAAEGMKQVQVSRLENPDYSGATINSLKRLANAFDLGLVVSFVRFSEFLDRITIQSPLKLVPPNYDEEQQQLSFADVSDNANWISVAKYSPEHYVVIDSPEHYGVAINLAVASSSSGAVETITARTMARNVKRPDVKSLVGEREFASAA